MDKVPARQSILFAALSKMATDANHVNGLMALESIGTLTAAQEMTLQEDTEIQSGRVGWTGMVSKRSLPHKSAMSVDTGERGADTKHVREEVKKHVRSAFNRAS